MCHLTRQTEARYRSCDKAQVGHDVRGRDHFEHRQLGDRRQSVGVEIECARSGPGAFEFDVLARVFDQLANARAAVHMGDDLEQEVGRGERGQHCRRIGRLVLVTHGASRNPHGPKVEGADQRVRLEYWISFCRVGTCAILRGASPRDDQRSTWNARVSRCGSLSTTQRSGVFKIRPPSQ